MYANFKAFEVIGLQSIIIHVQKYMFSVPACFFLFYLKKLLKNKKNTIFFQNFLFFFFFEEKIAFYIFRLPHQLFYLL